MRGVGRGLLESAHHNRLDLRVTDRSWRPWSRFVEQTVLAALKETLAPLEHRGRVHTHLGGQ